MEEWSSQTQQEESWTSGREIPLKVRGYEGERTLRVENSEELVRKIRETAGELGIGSYTVLINGREVRPSDVMSMNIDEVQEVEILPFDKGAL